MGLIATSTTWIVTWSLGAGVYGALETVTGRSLAFNCHAATFFGFELKKSSISSWVDILLPDGPCCVWFPQVVLVG